MHSIEVRKRAVAAYDAGNLSEAQIASLFGVGESTLRRWRRQLRETGSLQRGHFGNNPPRVRPEDEALVRRLVREQPDRTVDELVFVFVTETGRSCSESSMKRALARLGISRKKSRSRRRSS
jgi:transposase